ncbi:enoyl-CoA hydratase/isomerase family protein [Pseudomaricurvus alkylphenolicus]|uniref:enoyl-CoA hydratase/isomerase family protein n=1 Tax=Pseudomaricurvus alkylphenolicus TaxID=1306991 RepID=UPI00141EF36D|nr:enoyl-CoA hydratase/isomerase family protein [Pseudomaricurvus alkylphenolicus]NIB39267.1 enoyl-CoA hydratase/isomerase family protein [Pseudomaricurvus alkylphenolicus]
MTEPMVVTNIDARGVATVTMNNPDKHNAFDDAIIAQLTETFQSVANNPEVRILVLASEGKSFSAGADLGWMKRMATYTREENLRDSQALAEMLRVLNFMPQPTIARVQGAAFGGAVGLVSCCDLAVAAPRASFSLSEVKIGLIPATISPYVVAAMGQRAARRYFLTAERFSAISALENGLVSEVNEELDAVIDQWVEQLLGNSPAALTAAKQLVFDVAEREITAELIEDTCHRIADIRVSQEGQEGLGAFLDKRKAAWVRD